MARLRATRLDTSTLQPKQPVRSLGQGPDGVYLFCGCVMKGWSGWQLDVGVPRARHRLRTAGPGHSTWSSVTTASGVEICERKAVQW